mmetsp:Transcript_20390/g.30864  ORF Transcript_20390/g.30864 Transcript_20390/m.30864 type:complete len:137 (+) Transcript_20390:40-450(+)
MNGYGLCKLVLSQEEADNKRLGQEVSSRIRERHARFRRRRLANLEQSLAANDLPRFSEWLSMVASGELFKKSTQSLDQEARVIIESVEEDQLISTLTDLHDTFHHIFIIEKEAEDICRTPLPRAARSENSAAFCSY